MKKIIFKSVSIVLIAAHLCLVSFKDISFAQDGVDTAQSQQQEADNTKTGEATASKPQPIPPFLQDSDSQAPIATASASSSIPPVSVTGLNGFNLSVLQSFQSDPFTGKASFSIPIVAPPGRKGIQPNFSLNYSSGTGSGISGVGWMLDLGSIERSTKRGVPKYDSDDTFTFGPGAGSELVAISANEYRLKNEGAFMKFYFNGSYWIVTDKTGTKYYFGQTSESRQQDGSRIFKWCLDKVLDIYGNYLTISYIKESNQIYPFLIQYAGNENTALAPAYKIQFEYEARPDITSGYMSGFCVATSSRLSDISVKYNDQRVRRYHFSYILSNLNKSLLSGVAMFGADNETSLPPVAFDYQPQDGGWQLSGKQLPSEYSFDWTATLMDVNNDNYTDILVNNGRTNYLGTSSGDWDVSTNWRLPGNFTNGHGDCGWRFADINGDGWIDIINHTHTDGGTRAPYVYINNKSNGWDYDEAWSDAFPCNAYFTYNHHVGVPEWHEVMGWVMIDVNNDGYVDILRARGDGHQSYVNTGTGWQDSPVFSTPADANFANGSTQLGDINGDGLPDLVIATSSTKKVYINSGSGWQEEGSFNLPSDADLNFSNNSTQLVDINSDGRSDIVIAKSGVKKTYINIPASSNIWQLDNSFNLPDGDFTNNYGTRLADTKGKALLDILIYPSSSVNKVYTNRHNLIPAYLTKITNGIGAELNATYRPSTQLDNTGGDGRPDLPFPVYVVDTVVTHDAVHPASPDIIQRYEYKNGLFDFAEREFRGFGVVKTFDAEGNYTETFFKQDNIFKGRPYKQEVRDAAGNLFARTENTWLSRQLYPGITFVYLAQADNYIYDGDATFKQTRGHFEYDDYGNQTRVISDGDVSATGDEKTQVTEYVYNTSNWIVSLPKRAYLLDKDSAKVSEKWFYYDYAASIDTAPAKGLLTKEEIWLYNPLTGAESRVSSNYGYDPDYGNLTSATDALVHTTTTEYDNVVHSYATKVINALTHTVTSTYDYKTGQVLTSTDANNQTTTNVYDTLGRLEKVIGPLDSVTYPAAKFTYDLSVSPVKVKKEVKENYASPPDYLATYQFFDGLGRALEVKSPGEDHPQTGAHRQIISGIVKYNSKGQVIEKYFPYFVDSSADYVAPTFTTPHSSLIYDAVGRVKQVTNPNSTYSTVTYSDWVVTNTDENSHYKTSYSDAYGRIVKIEEHNDGETYTTNYFYDTQGNLIKTLDNQANVVQIWYDSLGRKIKMDDPDMGVWLYEYDAVGNLKKQTDAKNQVLEFQYDALNRLELKRATAPLAVGLAIYQYDHPTRPNCVGRLYKIMDRSGSTEFFYDVLGREINSFKDIFGAGGFVVERGYDALDRLVTLKYPDAEAINYTYNPQGIEKVEGLLPGGSPTIYITNIDYSPTGQIVRIQYGNGTETNYTYNPQTLRLDSFFTQSPFARIQDFSYMFDNTGNISSITDHVNTANQSFIYDDLDRLTNATGSYGSLNYVYDSIGNMIQKEGKTLTYGKAGKLPHAVTQFESDVIDYDNNGNMTKKGNLEYSYDVENRLIESKEILEDPNEILDIKFNFTSGWNFFSLPIEEDDLEINSVLGNITCCTAARILQVSRFNPIEERFEHFVNNSNFNQFNTFEYGKGYELYIETPDISTNVYFTGKGVESQEVQLKAGYNLIPCPVNRAAPVEQALEPLKLGIDYDKIVGYDKDNEQFVFYPQGSLTILEPGKAYFINCLKDSKLAIGIKNKPATNFVYDGDGGRVKKTAGADSTTYIGSLFEIDSDGKTKKHIFAGSNRIATQESSGNIYYTHSDHLGSSNVVTDSTGAQVGFTEFTPYGATFKQTGTYDPKHKFTGKELDASTDLYYYGARYYDPTLGRFIAADTIVQAPYDPQSLNRYSYCRNNPINYVDPTGHSWFSKFFKKFGGAIASVAFTFVGMPFIGALVGSAISTFTNGGNFQNFATGFGIGLVSGFVGGTLAGGIARGLNWNMAGIETAFLRGGLAGAIGGMGSAAVYGGNIGEGAWQGAAGGMAVGGLAWAKNAYTTNKFLKNNVKWDSSVNDADKAKFTQGIKELGQSPLGQREIGRFRRANFNLNIISISGDNAYSSTGPYATDIEINPNIEIYRQGRPSYEEAASRDFATLFGHEIGHSGPVSSVNPCGDDPLNVSYHENPYRSWIGTPSRTGYFQEGDVQFKQWFFQY